MSGEKRLGVLAQLVFAGVLGACSGSDASTPAPPADFSGSYTVSLTNGANGCNYANWQVGHAVQSIPFDITQSGADVTGEVKGLANVTFAILGIGALKGTASGTSASLSNVGTTSLKQGACAYFVRATADVTLSGNTINGTVTYRDETNKHPDCGTLETCTSMQSVAGSRPPK
jgi:hypothetical protein